MIPRQEVLVLTLPPDSGMARLARITSLHFFQQNGLRRLESRRQARKVEAQCRALLKGAGGAPRGRSGREARGEVVLTLRSGVGALEVTCRRSDPSSPRRRLRLERPGSG